MLEFIVVGSLLVLGLVVLPLLVIGTLLKLLLWLVLLPFRAVGALVGAAGAVLAGVGKVLLFLLGLVGAALALTFGVVLLPLLPLLLVGGLIWLLARLLRPRPVVASG